MPALLGYLPLRGLAQHIRFLLEYTETDYTEKLYNYGPAPDYNRPEWLQEKFQLGLDFPNLPYYIDGERKITQSNAILRYIARKHDLIGKTDDEVIKADMLENEAMDVRMGLIKVCYSSDYEKLKLPYETETLPEKLKHFSKCLGDKDWFLGEKIKYVDFFLYEVLAALKAFAPACLHKFGNLKKFMTRFEALEAIKKYMKSPTFVKFEKFHSPVGRL